MMADIVKSSHKTSISLSNEIIFTEDDFLSSVDR